MFIEENCERCGTCLTDCPYLHLTTEQAKEEINNMIKTRSTGEIINNCIGCSYCNTLCPTTSNPNDLIREIWYKNISKQGFPCF